MGTNKQWKRVPFDVELAKKIQSGEIEGRIVTEYGRVEIIDESINTKYPLYGEFSLLCAVTNRQGKTLKVYKKDGSPYYADDGCISLELPEEAPKHEFKLGDKVRIHCEGDQYDNKIGEVVDVLTNVLHVRVKALSFPYKINEVEFVSHGRVYNSVNSESSKHEFKPFDKVLVRYPDKTELCAPNSAWLPGIFQYKSVNSNLYFVSGKAYKDCIPYEGNEHLVSTTNNPV